MCWDLWWNLAMVDRAMAPVLSRYTLIGAKNRIDSSIKRERNHKPSWMMCVAAIFLASTDERATVVLEMWEMSLPA